MLRTTSVHGNLHLIGRPEKYLSWGLGPNGLGPNCTILATFLKVFPHLSSSPPSSPPSLSLSLSPSLPLSLSPPSQCDREEVDGEVSFSSSRECRTWQADLTGTPPPPLPPSSPPCHHLPLSLCRGEWPSWRQRLLYTRNSTRR